MHRVLALCGALLLLVSCGPPGKTYGDNGKASSAALQQLWYADGAWKTCLAADCRKAVSGLGADALTYNAYFGWKPEHDTTYLPILDKIGAAIPRFGAPCLDASCHVTSDEPMWDAVALLRAYDGNEQQSPGMEKAVAALDAFDRSKAYFGGACPEIAYLEPFGGKSKLKSLASESAYAKAELLIYHFSATEKDALNKAERRYLAARKYFFDPKAGLYTAYVIDDGKHCTQVPRRFLAGVNGNMIYAAYLLGTNRGDAYRRQAIDVAKAAATKLSDGRGVLANLEDENDSADPLAEAMYVLAFYWTQDFARDWVLRNAAAAEGARTASGSIGRFFDGPPPDEGTTAWQTSGGFAVTLAAQALQGGDVPSPPPGWQSAKKVRLDVKKLPQVIQFTGSGIALRGTLGDPCCPAGARIFIDGVETFDHTGIQQGNSPAGKIADAVLFAWQWPVPGKHAIRLEPNSPADAERSLHLTGYDVR